MENTLQIKDRVAVNKLPIVSRHISRGDVVVFRDPAYWLPIPPEENQNTAIKKFQEGLIAVGVLPNPAKQYLVKRVIGVGGDHVQCCATDGSLIINGKKTNEPYIFAGNKPSEMNFNVKVPYGKIWVMGDHRGASADSRYHQDDINNGMVPLSKVTGRVFGIIWPFGHASIVKSHDPVVK
jgi:signal peptidase I